MIFEIFAAFFKIGCFTIGGGYAMLPVIQHEVVERKGWLTNDEFTDSIAITNSLPGPLAVNCATFIGYRKARFAGAAAAALGAVLPSFLIILFIAAFFTQIKNNRIVEYVFAGIRPAVVALIAYAVIKLMKSVGISKINISISILALVMVLFLGIHPIVAIIIFGAAGCFLFRKEAAV